MAPDNNGVIHACYGGWDGLELHITGAHKPCRHPGESLEWVQTGPTAPAGGAPALAIALSQSGGPGDSGNTDDSDRDSVWEWITNAVPALTNALLLVGLSLLALSILLMPLGWLLARPRSWLGRLPIFRRLGPVLRVPPFEDGAMKAKIGTAFALLTQARIGGGRESGPYLYLVAGEEQPGPALADLQGLPQTQPLAVALSLLRLTWGRRPLIACGSLMPVDGERAAVSLSLRRSSRLIGGAELWPSEPLAPDLAATVSNRVLAVAAAGWIEHAAVDNTPGPRAGEIFLSRDARSWALFRAGAELSRISRLIEAEDHYERALAIDDENIGALVDLAHLRRLEKTFHGAEELACRAIGLIEKRNEMQRRARAGDPNWYRAQLVLATTYADQAKGGQRSGVNRKDRELRAKAHKLAVDVARAAIDARDRLERIVGSDQLRRVEKGEKICLYKGWRIVRRARQEGLSSCLRALRRAGGRRFDLDRAIELHNLLKTTFEPGLLLLVAANAPKLERLPDISSVRAGPRCDGGHGTLWREIDEARSNIRRQLDRPEQLDSRALIEYVEMLPQKSPRVVYNVACYYSHAAAHSAQRKQHLDTAFEYLRQSISRLPLLERRALMKHAEKDGDLLALRKARRRDLLKLWRLAPDGKKKQPDSESP